MKLIIAGGRNYRLTPSGIAALDEIYTACPITEVVSGGARGIDADGELWAASKNILITRFLADWTAHGKAAGPRRNAQMAEYADALAIFAGGAGSHDMRKRAVQAVLIIFDYMQREDFAS